MGVKEKIGGEAQMRIKSPAASNLSIPTHSSLSITDNRNSTASQRRLAEGINNSPQSIAQCQVQVQMNAHPTVAPLPVQYVSEKESEVDVMGERALQRKSKEGKKERSDPTVSQLVNINVMQLTKHGERIDFTFNSPNSLIVPEFSNNNNIFGASRFNYDVTFNVDEQGTKGTSDYRIGEFRQYYSKGIRVFGKKFGDWQDGWLEDTLTGSDHYGYRNANTQSSKYTVNEGGGDKLQMTDKPEVDNLSKPDEIAYDQPFKGEVVAVEEPGGEVKEILDSKIWTLKGVGTRDEKDNIYYGVYYSQLKQSRIKSANKSKRLRKEASGKYDKPVPHDK